MSNSNRMRNFFGWAYIVAFVVLTYLLMGQAAEVASTYSLGADMVFLTHLVLSATMAALVITIPVLLRGLWSFWQNRSHGQMAAACIALAMCAIYLWLFFNV